MNKGFARADGEKEVSRAKAKVAYKLHQEGIPLAGIARHMGVCTSAVAQMICKLK